MLDVGSNATIADPQEASSASDFNAMFSQVAFLPRIIDFADLDARSKPVHRTIGGSHHTWLDRDFAGNFRRIAGRPRASEAKAGILQPAGSTGTPGSYIAPRDPDYVDDIAAALGHLIDAKSPCTSGHSARVAAYADLIAQELGLARDHRRWVKRAALLHDIGKLGVSNEILHKVGNLDASEWAALRQHAALSETILSQIGAFQDVAPVVGAHHERLDGTGYPNGLRGDEITLETRIITTADVFDALTTERSYRAALPHATAKAIMAGDVGAALDARCFEALLAATRPS